MLFFCSVLSINLGFSRLKTFADLHRRNRIIKTFREKKGSFSGICMRYGLFASASQVQLDVDYEELIMAIRAFSRLEPVKALLFNNSVLLGEHEELACCRDMFWENSTHGINPHNIGMFDCEIESIEDLDYLRTFKFEDLTFCGTIEFRSVCCQPVADVMTVAAFHLGMKHQLKELDQLFREDHVLYHHGFSATEL